MSPESAPPPNGSENRGPGRFGSDQGWPRWTIWVLLGVIVAALFLPTLLNTQSGESITYGDFVQQLRDDQVADATYNNSNGQITGKLDNGPWPKFRRDLANTGRAAGF